MYTLTIRNDVLTICIDNQIKEHIHFSTNFPKYIFPPPHNLIKENKTVIKKLPDLSVKWKNGNFQEEIRMSQYEFDKFCYENINFGNKYSDNKKLYNYIQNKYLKN